MNASKKSKKLVLNQYDSIYNNCHTIAKSWGIKTISLVILKDIIESHKLNIDKIEIKELIVFQEQFNATLDKLYKILSYASSKMESKHIALCDIKAGLEVLKNGFKKGFDGKM